jgi:hypothetical protein
MKVRHSRRCSNASQGALQQGKPRNVVSNGLIGRPCPLPRSVVPWAPRLALLALSPAQAGQSSGIVNACAFLGGSGGVAGGAIAYALGGFRCRATSYRFFGKRVRRHCCVSDPWRTAPSRRTNLRFGSDSLCHLDVTRVRDASAEWDRQDAMLGGLIPGVTTHAESRARTYATAAP